MDERESSAAAEAYAALTEGDWPRFRLLLHPYLHWTRPDGSTIRGRVKVLAMLADRPALPGPPSAVELRDGQVYRWRE